VVRDGVGRSFRGAVVQSPVVSTPVGNHVVTVATVVRRDRRRRSDEARANP
jgi:hypothetical protein